MRTIRAKITLLFVVIFGFTLSAFAGALYFLYARQSAQNFDLNLSNDALEIAGQIKGDERLELEIQSGLIQQPLTANFGTNEYVQVLSIDGVIVIKSTSLRSLNLPVTPEVLALALSRHQVFQTLEKVTSSHLIKSGHLRVVTYPVFDNGIPTYLVQVASNTLILDQSLFGLRLLLLIGVPLTILAAALGGFYVAKKAFDPIDRIIRTAQSISAEHLDRRLETKRVDDEISRLSKTLNAMFDRIQDAFLLQKQFTADASHELKTPLTILLGEIEVALKNPRTTDDYVNILNSAVEEIKRITNIVDELLTMARLESGQLQLQMRSIRIDELLLDAISKTSAYASQRSIQINYEVQDITGREHEEVFVSADKDKLLSAFINLLDNAIKYSNDGSTIRVVQAAGKGTVKLQIIDKGVGIPPEDLPHIFDRFYRADKSRSSGATRRGSGLGLSIARSLIESHKGTITVLSQPGSGTTVTITLPALSVDDLAEPRTADVIS
ncbi:MAG: ATP-binding protein [Bacteroidetes bacterium]|nr:ATP-binding protein [Bacteroidota bacterium]MCL5034959.1 ATP-binding protein [Bacteroidota bacterium]